MFDEVVIEGHSITKEPRTGYYNGYGGMEVDRTEYWLVCTCGWEHKITSSDSRREDERLARLEHGLDALASQSCSQCSPNQPCEHHCPRRSKHSGQKAGSFCQSCGGQFTK